MFLYATDLEGSALIRERWAEERYQDVHHSRCYVVLKNNIGMVPIMCCNAHLSDDNEQQWAVIDCNANTHVLWHSFHGSVHCISFNKQINQFQKVTSTLHSHMPVLPVYHVTFYIYKLYNARERHIHCVHIKNNPKTHYLHVNMTSELRH